VDRRALKHAMKGRDEVVGRIVEPRVADREHVDVLAAGEKPVILVPENVPHRRPARTLRAPASGPGASPARVGILAFGTLRNFSPIAVAVPEGDALLAYDAADETFLTATGERIPHFLPAIGLRRRGVGERRWGGGGGLGGRWRWRRYRRRGRQRFGIWRRGGRLGSGATRLCRRRFGRGSGLAR